MSEGPGNKAKEPPDPGTAKPPQGGKNGNNSGGNAVELKPKKFVTDGFQGMTPALDKYFYRVIACDTIETFLRTSEYIGSYVAMNGSCYEGAGEYRTAFMTLSLPVLSPVTPLTDDEKKDNFKVREYFDEKKIMDTKIKNRTENESKIFPLIMGQCTEELKSKIKADKDFDAANLTNDTTMALLKIIRSLAYTTPRHGGDFSTSAIDAEKRFKNFKQDATMTDTEYYETFLSLLANLERMVGKLGYED